MTLRVSLEVSLLNRLEVARVRAWGKGLASWDRVGEVGGAWEGGRRSLSWPPWKVLRMLEPRVRREPAEEEVPEAPAMLWVEGEAGGSRWEMELFSFPFCSREGLSVLFLSVVHTYVFRRIMALAGTLFVAVIISLRRSGISDLLGLLALLTIGLEGGWMERLPTTLLLTFRDAMRPPSSFSSLSAPATLLGLRLGWDGGAAGPQKSLCLLRGW